MEKQTISAEDSRRRLPYAVVQISPRKWSVIHLGYFSGPDTEQVAVYGLSGVPFDSEIEALKSARRKNSNL
jgi:hypothetical protein